MLLMQDLPFLLSQLPQVLASAQESVMRYSTRICLPALRNCLILSTAGTFTAVKQPQPPGWKEHSPKKSAGLHQCSQALVSAFKLISSFSGCTPGQKSRPPHPPSHRYLPGHGGGPVREFLTPDSGGATGTQQSLCPGPGHPILQRLRVLAANSSLLLLSPEYCSLPCGSLLPSRDYFSTHVPFPGGVGAAERSCEQPMSE